jgi:hypothetical protein
MTAACFFWALETVLFKNVALEENVWKSLFWEHLVLMLIGVLLFVLIPRYRHNFLSVFRQNSVKIMLVNVLNESIYMVANISVAFVAMMAPVALVLLNVPIQTIFVFVIGAVLTLTLPQLLSEKLERQQVIQKLSAIVLTCVGTYVLIGS